MKRAVSILFIVALIVGTVNVPITEAANDYISVSRTVNPEKITVKDEAEVSLTIKGTPPVNVVKPNDVILVIDKSGSMAPGANNGEDKMQNAKDAAKGFIDLMDFTKHRVGIVDYSSTNMVDLFPLGTDTDAAKQYIGKINANGGTATGAAIDKAMAELQNVRPDTQPVIVIMTDGDATEPKGTAYEYAKQKAAEAKEKGIVFYTIALLKSTDDPDTSKPNLLLREMATTSDHHHFVLGSTGLKEIYAAIVKEIGVASAYDVSVTDEVSPDFEIVPGSYENNIPKPEVIGNKLTWNFKELKNKQLTFTYKIRPINEDKFGKIDVATSDAVITYKDYAGASRKLSIPNSRIQVDLQAPVITSVEDSFGHPNGGNKVTIKGDHFVQGAQVTFNNVSASNVEFVNKQQLDVIVPAGKQGSATVVVTNPDKQTATSSYQYKADPVVASITPNVGPFEGGNQVTIKGEYFMPGVKVIFGEKAGEVKTQTGDRYLLVTVPEADKAGAVDVKLKNPDGTELIIPQGYTYEEKLVPKLKITGVSPAKGAIVGGNTVYITGEVISPEVKAYFGEKEASVVAFSSSNRFSVKVPEASKAGVVSVKLVNPDGQTSVLDNGYEYEPEPELLPPSLTSITPTKGLVAGGGSAYVNGQNLVSGTKIFFGDTEAKVVSYLSEKRIQITIPAATNPGFVSIKAVLPDKKEAVLSDAYEYYEPQPEPVKITSVTPASGLITGGETVYINGDNFNSGIKVTFGGTPAVVSIASKTRLTVKAPAYSTPGTVDVQVTNTDGGTDTLKDGYTYEQLLPSITGLSPDKGTKLGGTGVYINGKFFEPTMKVQINGKDVPIENYYNDSRIRIITPASDTIGEVPVVITLANGLTANSTFTYEDPPKAPAPVIDSITPVASGPAAGGNTIYLNGSNLSNKLKVYFGNVEGTITGVYAKRISVRVPAGTSGSSVEVYLINEENSQSNKINYTYN